MQIQTPWMTQHRDRWNNTRRCSNPLRMDTDDGYRYRSIPGDIVLDPLFAIRTPILILTATIIGFIAPHSILLIIVINS